MFKTKILVYVTKTKGRESFLYESENYMKRGEKASEELQPSLSLYLSFPLPVFLSLSLLPTLLLFISLSELHFKKASHTFFLSCISILYYHEMIEMI